MSLSLKQKLRIIPLLLYWLVLFTLMHIPIPSTGQWKITIVLSDKILHFFAYLIFVFVVWFAIGHDRKVNWRKGVTWWIIAAMACYSILDEWLQIYVGRDPDVMDFVVDAAAIFSGLAILSLIPFWPATIVVTGVSTFFLVQFLKMNFCADMPFILMIFYILLFGFFTLIWTHYIQKLSLKGVKRKAVMFAGPIGLLFFIETSLAVKGMRLNFVNAALATLAITAVIILYYYMHKRFYDKNSHW